MKRKTETGKNAKKNKKSSQIKLIEVLKLLIVRNISTDFRLANTRMSASSSTVASVTSCDITRWATCELIGCPMKIMRLRNNTEERSKGPAGVLMAGIIGGFSPFALMTVSYLQEKVYNKPKYDNIKRTVHQD